MQFLKYFLIFLTDLSFMVLSKRSESGGYSNFYERMVLENLIILPLIFNESYFKQNTYVYAVKLWSNSTEIKYIY
jgi:hypothetical protein